MTDSALQSRNITKCAECYPVFGFRITRILKGLTIWGFRPRIKQLGGSALTFGTKKAFYEKI